MDAAKLKRRLSDRQMFGIEIDPGKLIRVYPPEGKTIDVEKVKDAIRAAGEDPGSYLIINSFLENAVLIGVNN